MPSLVKIVNVFLLATVKYFYTPIYAFIIGLDFFETIVTLIAGGIFGFFVFYYLSNMLILSARILKPSVIKYTPEGILNRMRIWKQKRAIKRKNRKKFSKRNKMIVKARSNYGMWGICLLTPVLLSIPLGAFLLRKYYHHRKGAIPIMVFAIILEGTIVSILSWYLYHVKNGLNL
ncbi:MAG: hypothetical protein C0591_04600 [Marinilabiliales bacterium]|nr:MAG: hypothetical protein C0591_04600 [Marinilabiliales bacterium]